VRWPLQPLQPFQKTQLQPPFGPSVESLCHPWITTTNLSYRFPIFDTSATALCGTTGNNNNNMYIIIYITIIDIITHNILIYIYIYSSCRLEIIPPYSHYNPHPIPVISTGTGAPQPPMRNCP
jgi:hypothetical protein